MLSMLQHFRNVYTIHPHFMDVATEVQQAEQICSKSKDGEWRSWDLILFWLQMPRLCIVSRCLSHIPLTVSEWAQQGSGVKVHFPWRVSSYFPTMGY